MTTLANAVVTKRSRPPTASVSYKPLTALPPLPVHHSDPPSTACLSTRKQTASRTCSLLGADGHRYRLIVLRWQQRHGCSCRWHRAVRRRLCGCRGPRKSRICRRGLLILKRITYQRSAASCRARVRTQRRRVRCPQPRRSSSPCRRGLRRIVTRHFSLTHNCGCRQQTRTRFLKCRKCIGKRLHFRVLRHRHRSRCLALDRRYGRRYHLATVHGLSYWACRKQCETNSRCISFDFFLAKSTGDCVLAAATWDSLTHMVGRKAVRGANAADLHRHRASKCIHSQKVCIKSKQC